MRYLYYPGCSLSGTAREYDESLRALAAALGIELEELTDWSCCGSTSAHAIGGELGRGLPALNLALAKKQAAGRELDGLLVPCAACYNNLARTARAVTNSEATRRGIAEVLEIAPEELTGVPPVLHVLQVLDRRDVRDALRAAVKRPLAGVTAVCYYGCLLVRPREIAIDDPENPRSMERVLKALGAQTLDWSHKVECCGGAHGISHKEVVISRVGELVSAARAVGANMIATACPLCQANVDLRQGEAEDKGEAIPVCYLTELAALALDLEGAEKCVAKHAVPFEAAGARAR